MAERRFEFVRNVGRRTRRIALEICELGDVVTDTMTAPPRRIRSRTDAVRGGEQ